MRAIDIVRKLKNKAITTGMLLTLEKLKKDKTLVVYTVNERRVYRKLGHNNFSEEIFPMKVVAFNGADCHSPVIYDEAKKLTRVEAEQLLRRVKRKRKRAELNLCRKFRDAQIRNDTDWKGFLNSLTPAEKRCFEDSIGSFTKLINGIAFDNMSKYE